MANLAGVLTIIVAAGNNPPVPGGTHTLLMTPNPLTLAPGTTEYVDLTVQYPDGTVGVPGSAIITQAFWKSTATGVQFNVESPSRISLIADQRAPNQTISLEIFMSGV